MPSPEKNGNFTLSRGGLYAGRKLSAEEQLERDTRTWAARGKVGGSGSYASRAVADIAQEARFPHRVPARIIREALEGGATPAWAREFGAILALAIATACSDVTAPHHELIDISQCGDLTPTRFALVYQHGSKRDTGQYYDNHFVQPLRTLDTLVTFGDGPTAVKIGIIRGPYTDSKCITLADSLIYRSYDAVGYVGKL